MAETLGRAPRRTFRSLRTRRDFDRVFERGRRIRLGPLTLVVARGEAGIGVGFKIGKKAGKAVRRNLVRRRLKALLERFEATEDRGLDLVFIVHASGALLPFSELMSRIRPVLERSGLRMRPPFLEEVPA